jgi:FkbM family methyltransferase
MNPLQMTAKIYRILITDGVGGVGARLRRRWRLATFRPHVLEKRYGDLSFRFFIGTREGQEWYGRFVDARLYKPLGPELAWFAENVGEGEIVADVGAHHGYFSTLFAHWVGPRGRVFSFECLPQNAAIAARNVALNHLSNVEVVERAVGARRGQAVIADHSGGILFDPTVSEKRLTVGMTSLDEFFTETHPTLLKIDVEGYEGEVLRGARACLTRRPKLALELHCFKFANPEAEVRQLLQLLPLDGYRYQVAWEAGDRLTPCVIDAALAADLARRYNPHVYGLPG